VPNTKGWFYKQLRYPSEASNLRGVDFGTQNTFIVKATTPHISHGTDTIVTPYDTGGIEIIPDHLVYANTEFVIFLGPVLVQNVCIEGATFLYGRFDLNYSSF
jgi:hypothetical protein